MSLRTQNSELGTQNSRRGVALVITLVMLSAITFLAVAFLILTQRERGSVSVAAAQTDAKLAAEAAVSRATVELLAPILAYGDTAPYGLGVSTNYINRNGFVVGNTSPTNVNYDYWADGGIWTGTQREQNIANLQYDARPPVYVVTNKATGAGDFRFYLDLNRNGKYEPSGNWPVINENGLYLNLDGTPGALPTANTAPPLNVLYENVSGDPEWIGILERPEFPHSSSNLFVSRYAYLVVPEGQTLDVNYIHNYAKAIDGNMRPGTDDGFLRNQGVGSWEINLAAFFADLNHNVWPLNEYNYTLSGSTAIGHGFVFDDALSFLRYRYGGSPNYYLNLKSPYLPANKDFGAVDEYTTGPLMTANSTVNDYDDHTATGYSGAQNPNRYFTPQDFFDPAKTRVDIANGINGFPERLALAGSWNSTYDRYTFYRMLAQLGTESAADNRMNLNYVNLDTTGKVVPDMVTNYIPWTALQFFTNAADRLLSTLDTNAYHVTENGDTFPLSVTNIPVYPKNAYTPAVHRLLQVAANLFDATQTNTSGNPVFPTVFRPLFRSDGSNVVIAGYEEVTNAAPAYEASVDASALGSVGGLIATNVYSVPWIVGAKKGFPNFNEFAMQTAAQITRKLSFDFTSANRRTNQMYLLGITNSFGLEAWNSYYSNYARPLTLYAANEMTSLIISSNGLQEIVLSSNRLGTNYLAQVASATAPWRGIDFTKQTQWAQSFKVPLNTSWPALRPSAFLGNVAAENNNGGFTPDISGSSPGWTNRYIVPTWWLRVTNRLKFFMVDTSVSGGRIIDFASFNDLGQGIDLTGALMGNDPDAGEESGILNSLWLTNRVGGDNYNLSAFTMGIQNQLRVCQWQSGYQVSDTTWARYGGQGSTTEARQDAIDRFRVNLGLSPNFRGTRSDYPVLREFDAPFQPTRTIYMQTTWQVNDPLVHHIGSDLVDITPGSASTTVNYLNPPQAKLPGLTNTTLGKLNSKRYEPWPNPKFPTVGNSESETKADLSLKDPLVTRSDDWDFPDHPLPNVGWIGRVHRGTPWQTIYLKSQPVNKDAWKEWTGNDRNAASANLDDSLAAMPTNDWRIADVFTSVLTDNASRGRLSVNQTNLAAWSAVLSGVLVLSNTVADGRYDINNGDADFPPPQFDTQIIEPAGSAGTNSPLGRIVDGINATRSGSNFYGSFKHLGDVLAAPELTVNSPCLNTSAVQRTNAISEAAYERIPQQILGLLRRDDTPRFTVYAYGQSLKPAERSIVSSGLCTNYQITSEVAIRSLVRIEGAPTNAHAVVESYNYLPPD